MTDPTLVMIATTAMIGFGVVGVGRGIVCSFRGTPPFFDKMCVRLIGAAWVCCGIAWLAVMGLQK
jgi:hypothetical protein